MAGLSLEFSALAKERGISFRMVPSRRTIRSDRRFLRRILQNFLSNALRYTPRGSVLMGCRRDGDNVRIEVWDTGPGIEPSKQTLIFEEFRRLQPKDQRGEKGLGLGLAIVDRMARMLDHRIAVRSWPGSGSVFSVTVPVTTGRPSLKTAPDTAWRPGGPLDGANVLCIDNEQTILDGMSALLGGWSCRVITATSADRAIDRLKATRVTPDIILADYYLDDNATGVEAIAAVTGYLDRTIPAVIITADYSEVLREQLVGEHKMVLRKPVKPARLRAMMTRLISKERKVG